MVKTGKGFLNFPRAMHHLTAVGPLQFHLNTSCYPGGRKWPPHQVWNHPPPLESLVCCWLAELNRTPGADIIWLGHQSTNYVFTLTVDPQFALWALDRVIAEYTVADSTGVIVGFLEDIMAKARDQKLGLLHVDMEPSAFQSTIDLCFYTDCGTTVCTVSTRSSYCWIHCGRQHRGNCRISWGHHDQGQRSETWSSSRWHGAFCIPVDHRSMFLHWLWNHSLHCEHSIELLLNTLWQTAQG